MNLFIPDKTKSQKPVKPMDDPVYKSLLWKTVDNKRRVWEGKFSIYFRKILNNELQKVIDAIGPDNCYDIDLPSKILDKENIEKALITCYYNVGTAFAKDQFNRLKADTGSIFLKEEPEDNWYEIFTAHVKANAGNKITSIVEQNRAQAKKTIRRVLDETIEEGLGAYETATRIRKALEKEGELLNQWRALRIARTEVMSASNLGAMEGARATGLAMNKFWIATYDSRTRDTHLVVEQQNPIDFNDTFKVGNYEMRQPGDERAGAEEIINCRCTVSFEVK